MSKELIEQLALEVHRNTLISIRRCFADAGGRKSTRRQITEARAIINSALDTLITDTQASTPKEGE